MGFHPPLNTAASGDVIGPVSSTDNAIARFDGTTGKIIQNSVVTISDTGATTGITTLGVSSTITSTLGTVVASTPAFSSTATWNNAAVTFVHHFANITDTASAAGSLLTQLQVGGNNIFTVGKAGTMTLGYSANTSNTSLTITSDAKSFISLVADTSNTNEDDTAYVMYTQDGGEVVAWAGLTGNANQLPDGTAYTGIQANAFVIGHSTGSNNGVAAIVRIGTTSSIAWQVTGTTGAHVFNSIATTAAGYTFNHTNTTANALTITGTTLTTGTSLRVYDNSADTSARNVAFIENDNAAATGNIVLRIKQDSTANAVFIDSNDNAIAINIDAENTTAIAADFVCDVLTTGGIARFYSNSADTGTRRLVSIINDNPAATGTTGLYIQNDSTGNAATFTGSASTGNGLFMQFDFLTTGSITYFYSNSSSSSTRSLVKILNDHASATGTTCLEIGNDSTGLALSVSGATSLQGGLIQKARNVASTTITVAATDTIVISTTGGAAVAASLPASPETGRIYTVKDGVGDAGTNNITITPAAGNIDGSGTKVINANYGSWSGVYNGTQWLTV